jgi:hypothetical protein
VLAPTAQKGRHGFSRDEEVALTKPESRNTPDHAGACRGSERWRTQAARPNITSVSLEEPCSDRRMHRRWQRAASLKRTAAQWMPGVRNRGVLAAPPHAYQWLGSPRKSCAQRANAAERHSPRQRDRARPIALAAATCAQSQQHHAKPGNDGNEVERADGVRTLCSAPQQHLKLRRLPWAVQSSALAEQHRTEPGACLTTQERRLPAGPCWRRWRDKPAKGEGVLPPSCAMPPGAPGGSVEMMKPQKDQPIPEATAGGRVQPAPFQRHGARWCRRKHEHRCACYQRIQRRGPTGSFIGSMDTGMKKSARVIEPLMTRWRGHESSSIGGRRSALRSVGIHRPELKVPPGFEPGLLTRGE